MRTTRTIVAALTSAVMIIGLSAGNALGADRFGYCGVVKAYTPPSQTQQGSVTVGSRTFSIAAGVAVGGTDLIQVGTKRCIAGDRDAPDRFTSLAAEATLLESTCGTVSEFRPATTAAQGSLVLNGFRFVPIREGTELPADSVSGHRCFTLTTTSGGDALITGSTDPPPGQAAAPTAAPIAALPSTSTNEIGTNEIGAVAPMIAVVVGLLAAFARRMRATRPT